MGGHCFTTSSQIVRTSEGRRKFSPTTNTLLSPPQASLVSQGTNGTRHSHSLWPVNWQNQLFTVETDTGNQSLGKDGVAAVELLCSGSADAGLSQSSSAPPDPHQQCGGQRGRDARPANWLRRCLQGPDARPAALPTVGRGLGRRVGQTTVPSAAQQRSWAHLLGQQAQCAAL